MHQATFQRRYNRSKPAQNRTKIKGVRAKPALESQHQEGTSQVHLPSGSALPAPGFLGDVVNESTTAKAQLITLLGFVVIQSFHGSLRLSGKTRRKRSDRQTRAEGGSCIPRHFWVFWLGSGKRQPEVTAPSAGKVLALRGSRDGDWPGGSQGHFRITPSCSIFSTKKGYAFQIKPHHHL